MTKSKDLVCKKLPLRPHPFRENGADARNFEVGVTNLFGSFRLEDFWEIPGGATKEECEEFITRMQAAANAITADIGKKRG